MPDPPQARHRAAASPTAHPETFLCTFCWRPRHPGDATPSMVVGRGARLACGPCYGALLDLAVCWVCGEVVFRGDECVSLGWCFWHRSCYGCLVCGDPRVARGVTVGELFAGGDDGGDGNKGREVDEVPLCAKCAGEVARDRAGDEQLVPMALGRIDRFDGGLSRRRWEAGMGRPPQRQAAAVQGDDARGARAGHRSAEEAAGTRGGPAQGAATGPRDHHQRFGISTTTPARSPDRAEQPDRCRAASPIYVSMHDPVGEPSFRPSRTKPIPKWMQQLPGQRQCARDCVDRPSSIVDDYFSPPEPSSTDSDSDSDSDTEAGARGPTPTQTPPPPPPPPPPAPPHTGTVRPAAPATREIHPTPHAGPNPSSTRGNSSSRRDAPHSTTSTTVPQARDPTFSPFQMSRPFTLIAEEPAQRPSSKLGEGRVPPSRHVRFISPPQACSPPSSASSSAPPGQRHGTGRASGPSEFVERYAGRHGHDVGGDGMVEHVDRAEGPGPAMSFQEQLMRVFGF